MKERQKANMLILNKLYNFFKENPGIRFFQGLQNLGMQESEGLHCGEEGNIGQYIEDNFYEESEVTLNKLK